VRLVAAIVGAVVASSPLFIDADDPLAHALDGLASELPDGAARTLKGAAELRRQVDESLLDRKTARHVRETWRSLLRLAEARCRLARGPGDRAETAVTRRLDQRLEEHTDALRRAYLAADDATAAEVTAHDVALRRVEHLTDSYEQTAKVLLDESAS